MLDPRVQTQKGNDKIKPLLFFSFLFFSIIFFFSSSDVYTYIHIHDSDVGISTSCQSHEGEGKLPSLTTYLEFYFPPLFFLHFCQTIYTLVLSFFRRLPVGYTKWCWELRALCMEKAGESFYSPVFRYALFFFFIHYIFFISISRLLLSKTDCRLFLPPYKGLI